MKTISDALAIRRRVYTRDVRRERTFTTQQIETLRDVYAPPAARRQF